jgi:hypothetical protein
MNKKSNVHGLIIRRLPGFKRIIQFISTETRKKARMNNGRAIKRTL